MTIEKVHTSSEVKSSSTSESKAAKGKSTAAEGASVGGFSALMSALDAVGEVVEVPVEDSPSVVPSDLTSALLPAALNTPVPEVVEDVPLDASALLSQSAQWGALASEGSASEVADAAQPKNPMLGNGNVANRSAVLPVSPQALPLSAPGHATQNLHKLAVSQFEQALQSQAAVSQAGAAGGNGPLDAQVMQVMEKREAGVVASPSAESTQVVAAAATRREERGQDHAIFKMNAAEPTVAPSAAPTGVATTAVQGASTVALAPEVYVAEQVKYWISNDVQNAEMKLDGFGDSPVEVSISMQGNEAQVAFRTDEARAREALENAGTHLKEMLQSEGLVLSGVSVGTADTGGAGAQERRGHGAVRQIAALTTPLKGESLQPLAARASGRTLDLFV